ncbi:carbohydrate ABC transporter permease [Microbacterium kyungheense]|uniref:Carbohydrate ABC transporter membrane protein 1 (CUT1 family) n=1 Tax=Microbacterium kyungheense TaxID=1263636 RepID=A0A543EQ12_9MICO|nr:sugar ABC transporter permease [Microbacterium kyungheense]TQM23665.1 carbohydrate ABC transporter membrane protein 1 (CUT1 family) [Microbacterium kyungheense]
MSTTTPVRRSRLHRREHRAALALVAIPIVGFLVFTGYPLVFSVYASFTKWNGLSEPVFNGIANFVEMANDRYFWQAMGNTIFYMIGIPIGLVLSLLLALALNRRMRGTTFFRTVYYVPVISSLAAVAILWQWAYNGDFGLVNQVLALFGIDGPNWLQNPDTVKPAIIIMAVWKGLGYSMLLYLAALQSVPRHLYEAAALDGAGAFQQFRHITVPMLNPVTFFLVVTSIIGGAQIFIEINIMTPTGGPEFSSASIVWYIWQKAFNYLQMGYATAMSVVLGLLVFVVTAIQFRLNRRFQFSID